MQLTAAQPYLLGALDRDLARLRAISAIAGSRIAISRSAMIGARATVPGFGPSPQDPDADAQHHDEEET